MVLFGKEKRIKGHRAKTASNQEIDVSVQIG